MPRKRRSITADFKARVALEAIRGQRTTVEIALPYGVHPNQVTAWKSQGIELLREGLADGRRRRASDEDALKGQLYRQIGQRKVELDWLRNTVAVAE